jgi:hypothetical protein
MHHSNAFLNEENIETRLCFLLNNNQLDSPRGIGNIRFEPQTQQEQERFSGEFVNHNLGHLQLSRLGSLEVRWQQLLAVL